MIEMVRDARFLLAASTSLDPIEESLYDHVPLQQHPVKDM
jgi:hypothetical protein